jgi:hypothetical protein
MFLDSKNYKEISPHPANVKYRRAPNNARKWQMGFNLAFKGLITKPKFPRLFLCSQLQGRAPTFKDYGSSTHTQCCPV